MRVFIVTVGVFFSLALSGCSITQRRQCEGWIGEGPYIASIDSCIQCIKTYGAGKKDLVMGCAMGLDAAALLVR